MATREYWKSPRCRRCGREIELLPYDGTGRMVPFDPIGPEQQADPLSRRYARYEDPETKQDRARLITAEEPFDEFSEVYLRMHVLTCPHPPHGYRAPKRDRVRAGGGR